MTHPNADLEALQKTSIQIQTCIGNMEDIVGLTYEDVMGDDNDS